jgi:hypothetical protein
LNQKKAESDIEQVCEYDDIQKEEYVQSNEEDCE